MPKEQGLYPFCSLLYPPLPVVQLCPDTFMPTNHRMWTESILIGMVGLLAAKATLPVVADADSPSAAPPRGRARPDGEQEPGDHLHGPSPERGITSCPPLPR